MTYGEFQNQIEEISNTELAEKAQSILSKLCSTGGQSFTMTVPPRIDDTDIILSEVIKRLSYLDIKKEKEISDNKNIFNSFKRTHPILLKCILSAMKEVEETKQPETTANEIVENWKKALLNTVGIVKSRYDSEVFTPPFRLGASQKRAILDSKGKEVIIMPINSDKQAQMYCDYLNVSAMGE